MDEPVNKTILDARTEHHHRCCRGCSRNSLLGGLLLLLPSVRQIDTGKEEEPESKERKPLRKQREPHVVFGVVRGNSSAATSAAAATACITTYKGETVMESNICIIRV